MIKGNHIRELRQRATSSIGSSCYKLISQFVQDFYQGALGRQPSASELSQWTATLTNAQMQGSGSLLGAAQSLGSVLFASTEYKNLNTDNSTYITDLYEGYLQRAPDPAGHANWLNFLNGGASRVTPAHCVCNQPGIPKQRNFCLRQPGRQQQRCQVSPRRQAGLHSCCYE